MTDEQKTISILYGQVTALQAMVTAMVAMHPEQEAIKLFLAQEIADNLDHKDKEFLLGMKLVHQHLSGLLESVQGNSWRTKHDYKQTP